MNTTNAVFGSIDLAHLSSVSSSTPKPGFTGAWATIEIQPDLFAPQRFTIGVVVQSAGDRLHFKLLDDFRKFECVYREQLPHRYISELAAYAEHALRSAVRYKAAFSEINFDTFHISISAPHYTSGENREVTVERLFDEVVIMSPTEQPKQQAFEAIDTLKARELVNAELKRIAQMDYDRIVVPDKQGILLDFEGSKHFLDLNILMAGACGSVTSAVYKTTPSVEINLLKSGRDLTTYSRVRKVDAIGLFLLLPDPTAIEPKDYSKIENVISEHKWKLERDGFRVVGMSSPRDLAEDIYAWAKPILEKSDL